MGNEEIRSDCIRNCKISIIVPVYKVEPYLHCCVDSILAQTFTDFELILVDDGSPDNCGVICDEYAAKDDRITVLHQENHGVSVARNTGLDWVFANSDSRWVTFVDSDDLILPNYLEVLHQYAVDTDADIVTTHGQFFHEDSELADAPTHVVSSRILTGREACISFYCEEELIHPFPWGKLCKKTILENLRFPVGIAYAEDEEWTVRLMYLSSQIVSLRAWLYCYRQRENSAVHRSFSMWVYDKLKVLDASVEFFSKNNEPEIIELAQKRRDKTAAKNMLLAYRAKMVDYVPEEYRVPVWKAVYVMLQESLRYGGIRHVFVRVQQLFKRTKRKHF